MRKIFLTLNYLALFVGLAAWVYVVVFASLGGPMRVTELDRAGAFNEDKLRVYSPYLAENLRNNVGLWIQQPTRSAACFFAIALIGLASVNIVGYHLLRGSTRSSAKYSTQREGGSQ